MCQNAFCPPRSLWIICYTTNISRPNPLRVFLEVKKTALRLAKNYKDRNFLSFDYNETIVKEAS